MKDEAFDREIADKFGDVYADVRAGQREAWLDDPRGRVAYVIVLDQFPRNMFRGTARAFEGDRQALAAAVEGVARHDDAGLTVNERSFLYMPYMHSEDIDMQERSVALFKELAESGAVRAPRLDGRGGAVRGEAPRDRRALRAFPAPEHGARAREHARGARLHRRARQRRSDVRDGQRSARSAACTRPRWSWPAWSARACSPSPARCCVTLPSPGLVLAAWAISGLLALCGAAVYAELGTMMPRVGGEYVYLSRAFGPATGFMSGWVALIVGFAAPTAVGALGFASYVHAIAPGAARRRLVAVALIVVVTAVHMLDVKLRRAVAGRAGGAGRRGHRAVRGGGARDRAPERREPGGRGAGRAGRGGRRRRRAGAGAFAVALVTVSYAYSGWNGAAYIAGEVRDPARALPRALVLGTGLVTLLYLVLNVVFLCGGARRSRWPGRSTWRTSPPARCSAPGARRIVSSLVALTAAGFVSAMTMSGPRVAVAMGEDGVFFRALGRVNRRGAPTLAVGLQGALAIVAVLTAAFERLLVYVGFTLTLNAAAAVLAAFVLRWREPSSERPHRALGWPASGALFLALSAFMLVLAVRERPRESAAALATLVAGGVAYAAWRRRRRPAMISP